MRSTSCWSAWEKRYGTRSALEGLRTRLPTWSACAGERRRDKPDVRYLDVVRDHVRYVHAHGYEFERIRAHYAFGSRVPVPVRRVNLETRPPRLEVITGPFP